MSGPRRRATSVDPADTVTVHSPAEVTVRKLIAADEPYLEGHYPDFTVYPGAFIVESVCEAVLHLVRHTSGADAWARPAGIQSVRFTSALAPGDTLEVHCVCRPTEAADVLAVEARCTNGGAKAAVIRMTFRTTTAADDAPGGPDA
ncbi:3-hydroxyacyl-ACP dehydratase FabZ family protein [Streptomyces sp. NPDC005551]|uniref:3-hydroxyacyl-ACP dehydratase FabZ family protein n=1 Tax=unclassified Streptomyces TaxID=2593676 RepID=UPI003404CECF